MGSLDGKVAIVTGGSSGIGLAIARAFAAQGASLVLAARNQERLEEVAAALRADGATALGVPTDVADEDQVVALFAAAEDAFGRVDVLVNNAGTVSRGPIEEISLETWRRVMDTNLLGPFLCSREAMKIMKRQRGGRIINIGSISAQVPRPNSAPYVTSKAGLTGLTRSIALEGRDHGIAASCLHPGNTHSELGFTNPDEGAEPRMSAADVAATVLTMAALPAYANILEAIILPVEQLYIGRG